MIEIKNLSVTYAGSNTNSLSGINLEIKKGELICVLGSLNSGKSTFCRCINGLIPHFIDSNISGDIIIEDVNNKDSNISELTSKVGMVLDNPLVQITGYGVTVEEEIAFGLENMSVKREEMIKVINDVLKIVDLEDERKKSPFDISGGQQQRLAIASILAMKPSILVMDEPTNQLDPIGTFEIFKELKKLKKNHTIILTTQKVSLIIGLADKILLLKEGKMLAFDDAKKILTNSKLLKKAGVKVPLIVELQDKKKIPISKISLNPVIVKKNLRGKN